MTRHLQFQRSVSSPSRCSGGAASGVEVLLRITRASSSWRAFGAKAMATENPYPAVDELHTKLRRSSVGWHSVPIPMVVRWDGEVDLL